MTYVTAIAAVFVTFGPSLTLAQGLADVAKAEEARRKTVQRPSKVYTNNDPRPDITPPASPAPSLSAGSATAATSAGTADAAPVSGAPSTASPAGAAAPGVTAPGQVRDQAYWSARITTARTQLERSRLFADSLQSRINGLTTDFVNRDDPAQRSVVGQDRAKAVAELDRVKKEMEDQTKAIAAIEDEARRAGVPPGWLR